TCWIVAQRHEVVEVPGVLDRRNAISFQPHTKHILIGRELWSCLNAEAQSLLGCHLYLLFLIYMRSRGWKPSIRSTLFIFWTVACTSLARNAFTRSSVSLRIGGVCS